MIRFLLRFLGLWVLAAGFIFLIYDGAKSIADQTLFVTKADDVWFAVHQESATRLQPAIEGVFGNWVWESAFAVVLEQPAWLILGIIGTVLIVAGRKKKPLIGYSRS